MKIKTLFFFILSLCFVSIFFHPSVVEAKILNKELVNKAVLTAGYSADFCPINLGDTPLNVGDFSSGFFKNKESYPCIENNEEVRFGQVTLYLRQNSEETPPKAIENVVLFGEDIFRLDSLEFIYYLNTNAGGTFFAGGGNENEIVKGLEIVKSSTLHRTDPKLPFGQEMVPNSEMSTHYDLSGNIDGILFRLAGKAYKLVTVNNKVYDKVLVDYTQETSAPTTDWKTYTNNFYHLELKYPNNYSLNENADKIEINSPLSKCNPPIVFNIEEYKQLYEMQIIIKKRYGSLEKILGEEGGKSYGWENKTFNDKKAFSIAVGAEMITPYTRFLVEGYPGEVLDIQAYVFASDDQGRCVPKLDVGNAQIISNQILSTFKFLDKSLTTQTITLKVTRLKTGFGIDGTTPTYPSSVTVSVPQSFSDQFEAYGVLYKTTLIGLKGWTGDGSVGADGSSTANLYPTGGSDVNGPHIIVREEPACVGCVYDSAAPYFPKARQLTKEVFNMDIPEKPGLVSNFITPQLLRYSLPNTSGGMEVNGVAYFTESVDPQFPVQPYFIGMEIVLPPQQHDLATLLLDIFIQRQNLNNK